MTPIELTSENLDSIFSNNEWIFINCWANWSSSCRFMVPIFEKLAKEYEQWIKFAEVNIEENPKIASKYEITAIPMFLLIHRGNVVEKVIGAVAESDLRKILDFVK